MDARQIAVGCAAKMAELDTEINEALAGKCATVISNYNGQQNGRSEPSWKGRIVHISHAFYSGYAGKPRITVWLEEERKGGGAAAVGLEELEISKEPK